MHACYLRFRVAPRLHNGAVLGLEASHACCGQVKEPVNFMTIKLGLSSNMHITINLLTLQRRPYGTFIISGTCNLWRYIQDLALHGTTPSVESQWPRQFNISPTSLCQSRRPPMNIQTALFKFGIGKNWIICERAYKLIKRLFRALHSWIISSSSRSSSKV